MLKKITVKAVNAKGAAKAMLKGFAKDVSGEGALDFIISALIAVIIGAALLGLLRVAVPDLWDNIMNKITDTFTL